MTFKSYILSIVICFFSMPLYALEVNSSSVISGQLPLRYGYNSGSVLGLHGALNISPAVSWSNVPAGTTSFSLTLTDLDEQIGGMNVLHWSLSNIPLELNYLPENLNSNTTFLTTHNISVNFTDFYDPVDLITFPGPAYVGPHPDLADVDNDLTHNYRLTLKAIGTGGLVLETATFDMSYTSVNLVDSTAPVVSGDLVTPFFTSATFLATSNEVASGYFVVVPLTDANPSASQIIAGRNANNQAVSTSGFKAMTTGVAQEFELTGLTSDTSYGVHLAVRDASGNISVTRKFFTTKSTALLALQFTEDTVGLSEGNSKTLQVKLSAAPSANLTLSVVASDEARLYVDTGSSLTFTSNNWNTFQDVAMVADFDADDTDSTVWVNMAVTAGVDKLVGRTRVAVNVTDVKVTAGDTLFNYQPGWNLISLPYSGLTIKGLEPMPNHFTSAWRWDTETRGYVPVANETVLTPGVGYWVYLSTMLTEANTIKTDQKVANQPLTLVAGSGWNLRGVSNDTPVTAVSGYQGSVWLWDNIRGQYEKVTDTLKPGIGYWFYAAE